MEGYPCSACGRVLATARGRASHMGQVCFSGSWQDRFWFKVDKDGPNGCWVWLGEKGRGYGSFRRAEGARHERAHRVSYELLVGPIPDGLTIDHLCRNPSCVNPARLEPVTPRVNVLRGQTITAANAAKTHCVRGHELAGENLYSYVKASGRTGRGCRLCRAMQDREAYARRSDPIPHARPPRPDVATVCANGHLRTDKNTYRGTRRGHVELSCRICNREAARRCQARRRTDMVP